MSRFDKITKALIVTIIFWTVAFFFAYLFKCGTHIDYALGPLINSMLCPTNANHLANGLYVSDFLTDLLILSLPLPMVSRFTLILDCDRSSSQRSGCKTQHVFGTKAFGDWSFAAWDHVNGLDRLLAEKN